MPFRYSRRLTFAAAFALTVLAGCRESHAGTVVLPAQAFPATFTTTPGGVAVSYPGWFTVAEQTEAETAIDAANPPVPAGWSVVIAVPQFEHPFDPTRLLAGYTILSEKRMVVGTRSCPNEAILPQLQHEIGHAVTGDPCAGHNPGDCSY